MTLVHQSPGNHISPLPVWVSAGPYGGRHAEMRHPVEHVAPDFRLGPLIGQSPGVQPPADDGLVAIHPRLDQAPAIVARTTLPADPSMLPDRCNMLIALRPRGLTRNGRCSWRDDNRGARVTIGNSIVDGLTIICAVCRQ